jgi:hypothetical protein
MSFETFVVIALILVILTYATRSFRGYISWWIAAFCMWVMLLSKAFDQIPTWLSFAWAALAGS